MLTRVGFQWCIIASVRYAKYSSRYISELFFLRETYCGNVKCNRVCKCHEDNQRFSHNFSTRFTQHVFSLKLCERGLMSPSYISYVVRCSNPSLTFDFFLPCFMTEADISGVINELNEFRCTFVRFGSRQNFFNC